MIYHVSICYILQNGDCITLTFKTLTKSPTPALFLHG